MNYGFGLLALGVAFLFVCGCGSVAHRVDGVVERVESEPDDIRPVPVATATTCQFGIVRIRKGTSCGSGFVVAYDQRTREATIWTCGHVVGAGSAGESVDIEWVAGASPNGKARTSRAKIEFSAVDGSRDFAELSGIAPDGVEVRRFEINRASPVAGDRGFCIGHPSCGWMVGGPIIVRSERFGGGLVPFTPAFAKGASGSPVLDASGCVVGILTYSTTRGERYAIAGPISQGLETVETTALKKLPSGVKRLGELPDEQSSNRRGVRDRVSVSVVPTSRESGTNE